MSGEGRWSLGPADSPPARLALYASESAFGGAAVAVLLGLAGTDPGDGTLLLAAAVGVAVAVWAFRTWSAVADSLATGERAWGERRRWRWMLAGTALAGFLVADAVALGRPPALFAAGFLLAAAALRSVGWFFCSSGRVDPATLTLSYDGRFEADLSRLVAAHPVDLGSVTVLWLTFEREYATEVPVLYVVPTDVVEGFLDAFEAGIAARSQEDPDPTPAGGQ